MSGTGLRGRLTVAHTSEALTELILDLVGARPAKPTGPVRRRA